MPLVTQRSLLARQYVVQDGFDRADNASSLGVAPTGHAWIVQSGAWRIIGGKANESANTGQASVVIDPGVGNVIVECDLTVGTAATREPSLVVRGTDDNNYLMFVANGQGGTLSSYKRDAGLFTDLGGVVYTFTSGVTYRFRVHAIGNQIDVYVNDALIKSYTLTGDEITKYGPAKTRVGLRSHADADASNRFDNFRVTVVA